MARFISIVSKTKGAGKTTVALNLGLALHNHGQKVLVFDADFSKPNMIEHLNMNSSPLNSSSMNHLPASLDDVFDGRNHIFDSIYRHASGLNIIPSLTYKDYSKLSFHFQDFKPDYDFIILDTPMDDIGLSEVLRNSDEAIIVHSPSFSPKMISDSINMLKKHKILNLGLVLNKSSDHDLNNFFGIPADIPIIAKILADERIKRSYLVKHPVIYSFPKSKISKEFNNLAKKLII